MKRIVHAGSVIALGGAVLWAAAYEPAAQQPLQRRAAAQSGTAGRWPARLVDGQPDVQGIWQAIGTSGLTIEALANPNGRVGAVAPTLVVDPPGGLIPYLPWARARRDEVRDHHLTPGDAQVDTRNRGWPDGVPRINYYSVNPFQIIQPAGAVVILYEAQHEFRYIPLDSRPQIDSGVKLWMGSSRGRWEGTTLVVDVTNVSDRVRLAVTGDFHSDDVRITERWKFVDADTIEHSSTFVDPKVYARPWTMVVTIKRVKDEGFEILEYAGVEGEKDAHLMVDIPASIPRK